jgi:hypothetical protein
MKAMASGQNEMPFVNTDMFKDTYRQKPKFTAG